MNLGLAVGCASALALVACSSDTATPAATVPAMAAAPVPSASPVPFEAVSVFKTACGPCHGETGEGNGPAGVVLTPRPANFSDASFWEGKDKVYIAKVIKEGGAAVGKSPLMMAWGGQYNDEQIGALADVVMGFKK